MCFVSNPKDSRSEPKGLKNFVSSRKVSFGKFRWTPRMHSWQNSIILASQIFLRKTIRSYKIVSSSKETFFKKFYWSRRFQFWHPCWKVLTTFGIFSFKMIKEGRFNVFFAKKPFDSKCFSEHMACSFDLSAVFVSPETRNILSQSPKVWKGLFLLEKCPSESSAGYLECVPDKTGVFEKAFQKVLVVTQFSVLTPLSKSFAKIWSLFFQK